MLALVAVMLNKPPGICAETVCFRPPGPRNLSYGKLSACGNNRRPN